MGKRQQLSCWARTRIDPRACWDTTRRAELLSSQAHKADRPVGLHARCYGRADGCCAIDGPSQAISEFSLGEFVNALLLILAKSAEHSSCADQQLTCFSHLGVDIYREAVLSCVLGVQIDSFKAAWGAWFYANKLKG